MNSILYDTILYDSNLHYKHMFNNWFINYVKLINIVHFSYITKYVGFTVHVFFFLQNRFRFTTISRQYYISLDIFFLKYQ